MMMTEITNDDLPRNDEPPVYIAIPFIDEEPAMVYKTLFMNFAHYSDRLPTYKIIIII